MNRAEILDRCIKDVYLDEMNKAIEQGAHTREDFGLCPGHMHAVEQRAMEMAAAQITPVFFVIVPDIGIPVAFSTN